MRKTWIVALVALLACFAACKKSKEAEPTAAPTVPAQAATPATPAPTAAPTAVPAQAAAPTTPPPVVAPPPPPAAAAEAQVCAGYHHTCVMKADGHVLCAGRNLDGQLGDGTTEERRLPVPVEGITDAVQLVCGYQHACVRHQTGEVSCWGQSFHGELGNGALTPSQLPVKVTGLADVEQLAAGDGFTCARVKGGKVLCWGLADDGRLGNGSTEGNSPTPAEVKDLADATQIGAGRAHACAVKAGGELVCWGNGARGQLGQGDSTGASATPLPVAGLTEVKFVAGGGNHTCAWTAAGLKCWGATDYGQVGNGKAESGTSVGTPQDIAGLDNVTQLALSTTRSCAVQADGAVKCWGYNNYTANMLLVGAEGQSVATPTAVPDLAGTRQLAVSDDHACALLQGGKVACWGSQDYGKLGIGPTNWDKGLKVLAADVAALTGEAPARASFPATLDAPPVVVPHLAVGDKHVCSVTTDGRVLCFGDNYEGTLGIGSSESRAAGAALPVVGLTDAVQVAAAMSTTCARRANGEVACWGKLLRSSSSLPLPVPGLTDVAEIALGGAGLICARKTDGTVWCWGENNSGQCGTGARSNDPILEPAQVQGLEHAVQLAVASDTACALREDGKVLCWGSDYHGALGNGPEEDSLAPVEVPRLSRVTSLSGSGSNFCVVAGGKVQCWGDNSDGQIGNGKVDSENPALVPTAAAGVSNAATVRTGWGATCAVLKNGEALCWGANSFGQTGHDESDTADVSRAWPVLREQDETVKTFGGYVTLGCGRNNCCGLHLDGHISCAGSTPINGGSDFIGQGVANGVHPIPAGDLVFPPPAAPTP